MVRALQESWTLFLGLLLLMISNGLLVTLLTLRGAELGFSQTTIGIMQACYPLGALFGCVVVPRLIEQVGHIRTFGALASLCSTAALIHMLTQDPFSWSAMRFLAGFCFTGLYVIAESWLNARAQNQNRAAILSIYFIVQTGGSASGVAMVGLPDPSGGLLFAITSILVSICLVPMLITRVKAPEYSAPDRLSIRTLIGISPMAVSGAVLNGMAQVALFVGLPLYGLARGMSDGQAASLLVIVPLSDMPVSHRLVIRPDGSPLGGGRGLPDWGWLLCALGCRANGDLALRRPGRNGGCDIPDLLPVCCPCQ